MAAALTYSDWFKQVPYGLAILEYDEQIHSNKKKYKENYFFHFFAFLKIFGNKNAIKHENLSFGGINVD